MFTHMQTHTEARRTLSAFILHAARLHLYAAVDDHLLVLTSIHIRTY